MGSLSINGIKKQSATETGYLYVDLHLDLENDYKIRSNFSKSTTKLIDIKVDYDEYAIKNSIIALFGTSPGQRLLNPEYGLRLEQFIFLPVSKVRAMSIGTIIKEGIERWEPRVTVEQIVINPVEDDNRYDISLDLFIPSLGKPVGIDSELVQYQGLTVK